MISIILVYAEDCHIILDILKKLIIPIVPDTFIYNTFRKNSLNLEFFGFSKNSSGADSSSIFP